MTPCKCKISSDTDQTTYLFIRLPCWALCSLASDYSGLCLLVLRRKNGRMPNCAGFCRMSVSLFADSRSTSPNPNPKRTGTARPQPVASIHRKVWVCRCSRVITVLAWSAEGPRFKSWFSHLSRVGVCYGINFLGGQARCAESAVKHQPTQPSYRKVWGPNSSAEEHPGPNSVLV